jgi:predicted Na+-dependent transporter
MTFAGSLHMKFKDVKIFVKHPVLIVFTMVFLHLLMPLWVYFLSTVIFDDHLLTVGFIVSVAVPTGVSSVIWINICKGNLPLGLSIILINTLLSPFIIPAMLHIVSGEQIHLDVASLMLNLILMIVLPTILGILVNELSKGEIPKRYGKKLSPISKLCLLTVIMINSSAIAPYLKDFNLHLISVLLLVFFVAVSGYAFALLIGRYILKDYPQMITLIFTGGMRNIALGVIVATTYFPSKVAMPVVFGMLFQQVLASVFSKVATKSAVPLNNPLSL